MIFSKTTVLAKVTLGFKRTRQMLHLAPAAPSSRSHSLEEPKSTVKNCYKQQALSVAPMMDWTDIHFRQVARLMSKHTWLYTEMIVDQTVLHAEPRDKWLWFPEEQHPIVCQLGGSTPDTLAKAAAIVEEYGYDEINLNCGCPSDRVAGAGCFGASLMLQPENVAACCAAMKRATSITVTIKCRIGVDKVDSYEALTNFIRTVAEKGGVSHFIIHARKCILKGLSPAQNRTVPPLRRSWVFALKRDFPELDFSLNGVVESIEEAAAINAHCHEGARVYGTMIGRAAYNQPWLCLSDADRQVFGAAENAATSRRQVLADYAKYGDAIMGKWGQKRDGSSVPGIKALIKPLLGIFHGERGTKKWKQELDRILKNAQHRPDLTVSQVLKEALLVVPVDVLDAPPQSRAMPGVSVTELPERPESHVPVDLSSSNSFQRSSRAELLENIPEHYTDYTGELAYNAAADAPSISGAIAFESVTAARSAAAPTASSEKQSGVSEVFDPARKHASRSGGIECSQMQEEMSLSPEIIHRTEVTSPQIARVRS